jgi:hypothetical protein
MLTGFAVVESALLAPTLLIMGLQRHDKSIEAEAKERIETVGREGASL